MNIWIFIISVVMVFGILFGASFENIYDFYMYTLPMTTFAVNDVVAPPPHVHLVYLEKQFYEMPTKDIVLNDDNTMSVVFGGGKSVWNNFSIPAFSYNQTFHQNQTFVARCVEYDGHNYLGFWKYLGTTVHYEKLGILLWHYEGLTEKPMKCDYPEIIAHSIDLTDHFTSEHMEQVQSRYKLDDLSARG